MVFFSSLVVLSAIAGSLASPFEVKRGDGAVADFVLDRRESSSLALSRRQNYNQDYTTGGTVSYSPTSNGFSVNWNTQNDFVVGKGWTTGSTSPITYSGTFSPSSGTGLLSIYGWSTGPLVEYYIMEDSLSYPNTDAVKGSYTSDGATYNIYEDTRTNEPSIQGTSTFNQYISVRQSKRTSGTVTVATHFAAWAAHGMSLGSLSYQVLAVEGWGGAGSASLTLSQGASTGTGTGTGTGSGSLSKYSQCGGIGWSGSGTCVSGTTCTYSSAYYSQCL